MHLSNKVLNGMRARALAKPHAKMSMSLVPKKMTVPGSSASLHNPAYHEHPAVTAHPAFHVHPLLHLHLPSMRTLPAMKA
eukprot:359124-Chlamydomonas_euryale.AAC.3